MSKATKVKWLARLVVAAVAGVAAGIAWSVAGALGCPDLTGNLLAGVIAVGMVLPTLKG